MENLNLVTSDQVYILSLDILGFSKLVENNRHPDLVDIFEHLINTWTADLKLTNEHYLTKIDDTITADIKSLFISDTILMYSLTAEIESFLKLVFLTQILLANSFNLGVPLRGCLTSGELAVKHIKNNDLIFGKPIVEAYNFEKIQEWAGCCITTKCLSTVERFHINKDKPCLDWLIRRKDLIKYRVPLKDNKSDELLVVNWVPIAMNILRLNKESIINAFFRYNKQPDSEIEIKKTKRKVDNTLQFWEKNTT
jgi:hypothetical protein